MMMMLAHVVLHAYGAHNRASVLVRRAAGGVLGGALLPLRVAESLEVDGPAQTVVVLTGSLPAANRAWAEWRASCTHAWPENCDENCDGSVAVSVTIPALWGRAHARGVCVCVVCVLCVCVYVCVCVRVYVCERVLQKDTHVRIHVHK